MTFYINTGNPSYISTSGVFFTRYVIDVSKAGPSAHSQYNPGCFIRPQRLSTTEPLLVAVSGSSYPMISIESLRATVANQGRSVNGIDQKYPWVTEDAMSPHDVKRVYWYMYFTYDVYDILGTVSHGFRSQNYMYGRINFTYLQ